MGGWEVTLFLGGDPPKKCKLQNFPGGSHFSRVKGVGMAVDALNGKPCAEAMLLPVP